MPILSTSERSSPPTSRRPRFWQRPWPVRTALALFALSVVLPTLLFIALQYRSAIVEKQAEVERLGRQYSRVVAADIGRELAIKRAQLAALATSQSLRTGDYAAFYAQAGAALKGGSGRVALLRADGEHILNTLKPFGTPLEPSRIRDVMAQVVSTGQPAESRPVQELGHRAIYHCLALSGRLQRPRPQWQPAGRSSERRAGELGASGVARRHDRSHRHDHRP